MNKPELIGAAIPIRDAALKVTGQMKYVADMKRPGMLEARLLLSPHAHARIQSIDTSEAEKLPGVFAVACFKNTPNVLFNSYQRYFEHELPETELVFSDTMRFVGDRVAAVAAVNGKTAEAALHLIKVEYELLPAVFDVEKALEEGAPAIHPGGNRVGETVCEAGNVDKAFQECDLVLEERYEMPAVHHAAIETHTAIADYDARGKLTIWSPNQSTFTCRMLIAKIFSLPMNRIRAISPVMGGAFGGKNEMSLEPVVAALALMAHRPVKLVLNRREDMVASRTRHAAVIYIKTGVMRDGTIHAQDVRVLANAGGYASGSTNVISAMSGKLFKAYRTPNMRFTGIPVYTNLPIAGAMRGYGSPQIFNANQAQLARIARELGMDIVELQLKNAVLPGGVDQRDMTPLGNPRLREAIARGAELFGWQERKKERPLEAGWKRGIGMALGAHGNGLFGVYRDLTALSLKVNEDGTFVLYTGAHDMGSGIVTVQTQMVANALGIQPEEIECVEADTDLVPWNMGDYASRGVFVEGAAAIKVAESMKAKMAEKASNFLDCMTCEVEFANGRVFVKGDPERSMTLGELVVKTQQSDQEELLASETYHAVFQPTSYGVHFAEVLVNEATGQVKVVDYVAVHDVGKVVNRMSIEGQVEGAIQMGIGYALSEKMIFDARGKLTNNNLKKYVVPRASDMPRIRVDFIERLEPSGPHGAKSIGECAAVPVAPAVFNAVCDAIKQDLTEYPVNLKPIK